MASEKITKFVEDIKTLSVLELAELVDAIQEEFGVTAMVAAAPAAGGAAGGEAAKTEFDVVLASFGDAKMAVIKAAKETGVIVTAEEHSVIGGLGSAVADVVCEECPVPVLRVGVEDEYGASGPAVEMLKIYGLTADNIVAKAKAAVALKK